MTSRSATNHEVRRLKRNIDTTVSRAQDLTMSPPPFHHGALAKSLFENSIVSSDCVFPIRDKTRSLGAAASAAASAASVEPVVLRRVAATLFDVPGIFTLYRERNPAVVELSYSAPKKWSLLNYLL